MRGLSILAAAFVAAALLPGAANALTCYTVIDRNDATIYQDSQPPFDLSSEGGPAARSALRARNEFLTVSEVEHCLPISAPPGSTAYRAASVDEIVSGMRAFATGTGSSGASSGGGRASAGSTTKAAPAASSSARKY